MFLVIQQPNRLLQSAPVIGADTVTVAMRLLNMPVDVNQRSHQMLLPMRKYVFLISAQRYNRIKSDISQLRENGRLSCDRFISSLTESRVKFIQKFIVIFPVDHA